MKFSPLELLLVISIAVIVGIVLVYYWNMRSAVGVLRAEDKVLCLSSGGICVLIIVFVVIKSIKNK